MAVKGLTALKKGGAIHKHVGKGASEQVLPHRGALNSLTAGNPMARTINDYAKASPVNNPADDSTPDIQGM